MPRQFGLKSKPRQPQRSKANDLEGRQDMGGKHGGQAGVPKSPRRPHTTKRDDDVVRKRSVKSS